MNAILLALSGEPETVPRITRVLFQRTFFEDMEGFEPPSYQPDLIEN